jgi:hypothetical protein
MVGDVTFAHRALDLSLGIEAAIILGVLTLLLHPASKAKFKKG